MLFLRYIPPAKFRGEISHGEVDNSRTREMRYVRLRICPLRGPREEVKYWTRSTCNFGNFASERACSIIEPPLRLFRKGGSADTPRLGSALDSLLVSHAFLRPHVVDSIPSLPHPDTSARCLKSMNFARRKIVSILKLYPPTSKDSSKIRQECAINFQTIFISDEIILLFAINLFPNFRDIWSTNRPDRSVL